MPSFTPAAILRALAGGLTLVAVATPGMASAAGTPKPRSYSSPGYKGAKSIANVTPAPLPLVTLGTGKDPHVLVDAAGTGHVMFATDGGTASPDTVAYCRLLRGQKACSSTASLAPDAPAGGTNNGFISNFPAGNHDFDGPVPLALGNQLFLVDRRFPDTFTTPEGLSDSNVFEWTSQDGGGSFTGPGLVGDNEMGGGAVVYGDENNPSIGTISRTQTTGTTFQGVSAGRYSTAKAQLGSSDQAYDGSLAVDGTRPVAAFADEIHGPTGTVIVREWSGNGDVNDAGTWTSVSFPGSAPRIAGGPAGVYVIYRDSLSGGNILVRQITGGGSALGAPTLLASGGSEASIAEDGAGGLVTGWIDAAGVELRKATGPLSWSPAELIAATPANGSLGHLALAATGDGGGFATMIENATGAEGIGQVVAGVFGTQQATGLPGLGQLAGGGIDSAAGDQFATASCTTLTFGAVVAKQSQCWLHDPTNASVNVTLGEVNLNGLKLIPDAGVKIAIDPKHHTIDTSGSVSVVLSGDGLNITLFHGVLHVKLGAASIGTDLFDFKGLTGPNAVLPSVAGFPIDGDIDVKLVKDGVSIPISLALPKVFGGITGSATLTASLTSGLQLTSLEFTVADVNFGGAELKGVDVSYAHATDLWSGKATLNVPQGGSAFSLSLDIAFQNGQYKSGSISLGLPYPGIPLDDTDTPPQLFLSGGGASLGLDPLTVTGKASFGLVPLYTDTTQGGGSARDYVFSLDGTLGVSFGNPITLKATADGYLYTLHVTNGTLTYGIPDQVSLVGSDEFHLGPIGETGSLSAVIDPKHDKYGGQVSGAFTIDLAAVGVPSLALKALGSDDGKVTIPTAALAFNDKGIGAYVPFVPIPFTIAYEWGGLPEVIPFVKHLGEFTSGLPGTGSRASREAAGPTNTFTVPKGAPSMGLVVHGADGPPSVVLTDPEGKTVTPSTTFAAGATAVEIADPADNVTTVGLQAPAAGTWTVTQAGGSQVAVAGVQAAPGLKDPIVKASVSAKGAKRTLKYSVDAPSGLSVAFAEQGKSTYQVIGTAKRKQGSISFTPVAGGSAKRKIVALITGAGGVPDSSPVVASFRAPPTPKPTKPAGLKVKAGKHRFTVTFSVPTSAVRTVVQITATDGRHLQEVLPRKTHRLTVPVVGFKDGVKVKVTGINVLGKRGATATGSAQNRS